jgi:hypothetical protein
MKLIPTQPGFNQVARQRREIVRKWEESGLLDNFMLPGKVNIAELMEGEASKLLDESRSLDYELKMYERKFMRHSEKGIESLMKKYLLKIIEAKIKIIKRDHCETRTNT